MTPADREIRMLVVLLRGSSREIPLRATASDKAFGRMVRIGRSWRVARFTSGGGRSTPAALLNAYELMLALNADLECGSDFATIREARP